MSFLNLHLPVRMLAVSACLAIGVLCANTGAASADGFTVSLVARSAKDANLLSSAVRLYALHRDLRAGADLRQTGKGHSALLHQSGQGQQAIIRQRGAGHSASVSQRGDPNAQVILQFGRGARADIVQSGGESGLLVQFRR